MLGNTSRSFIPGAHSATHHKFSNMMPALSILRVSIVAFSFCIGALLTSSSVQAQERLAAPPLGAGKTFVGLESGLNSKVGLIGLRLQTAPNNRAVVGLGAGLGTWGIKLGFYGRYYFKESFRGSYLHLGYSLATGRRNFETELEIEDTDLGSIENRMVLLDLNPVGLIDLGYGYSARITPNSRLYFQTGIAFRTARVVDTYDLRTDGVRLTGTSETVMQILSPGGLILAIGIDFGL